MMRSARPSSMETRRDNRRRIIVGTSGLFVMFMLVALAGLLTGQARQEAATAKAEAQAAGVINPGGAGAAQANEPLVDLGVAPALDDPAKQSEQSLRTPGRAEGARGTMPVPGQQGAVVVPDLQPDPQLQAAQRAR